MVNNTTMPKGAMARSVSTGAIDPADLGFFVTLAASGSLSVAGRELGVSTAAVSKRLAQMEARAGVALVNRTTRRMSLTPEGEIYLDHARRILGDIDALGQQIGGPRTQPTGLLRVNATLGFGRRHVAPVIARYVRLYPGVQVQLQLSVDPPPLTEDAFDLCIRFGPPPDGRVVARRLARNRRLLCASPEYLARHGEPRTPADLARHNCIGIRQGDDAYGTWTLIDAHNGRPQSTRVRGNLATNDGEIAVSWALDGLGIVMRAEWDVHQHLNSGRLLRVLPSHETPDADIYAVYPQRRQTPNRVRHFCAFIAATFAT